MPMQNLNDFHGAVRARARTTTTRRSEDLYIDLDRPAVVFVDGLNGFGAVPGCVNSAIAGEFVRGGSLRFFFHKE